MNVQELVSEARDIFNARRFIGEPYEKNGVTLIPVVAMGGGGGGGGGESPDNKGSGGGGGFGVGARPVGAWVIRGDTVRWLPAIDVNRVVAGGEIVAVVALLTLRSLARARLRRAKIEARRRAG